LLTDYFDIMFAYLKSRMKRVIQFVNKVGPTLPKDYIMTNFVVLPDYQENKVEFEKINRNYLEPEFNISSNNGFQLIFDENRDENYSDVLTKECMD